jgi:biopolymer transport protein ExbB
MDYFVSLFYKGGILMWPILFVGILSLSVFIERYVYLTYTNIYKENLLNILYNYNHKESIIEQLKNRFKNKIYKNETLILLNLYFENPSSKREIVVKREGEQLIKNLNKRISVLSLNAQIAPLLGLLGTVIGMIEAFQNISELSSQVAPSIIASGIWVAMLTTAFGLIVAIPSYIFYFILESKIESRIDLLNFVLSYLEEKQKDIE